NLGPAPQHGCAFLYGLLPRLILIENQDYFIKPKEIVPVLGDGLLRPLDAVGNGYNRPFVPLHLAHGEGVDFTLSDDHPLSCTGPAVEPERHSVLDGAEYREGL